MIAYIVISYVIAFVWAFIAVLLGESLKDNFKWWVLAPVSLPCAIIVRFIGW